MCKICTVILYSTLRDTTRRVSVLFLIGEARFG